MTHPELCAVAAIEILPAHPIITAPVATAVTGLLDLIAGLDARSDPAWWKDKLHN